MRVNIYTEELPDIVTVKPIEIVSTMTGRNMEDIYGARLYLKSASELHNEPGDDDRSAITLWGPPKKVAAILREMADQMERAGQPPRDDALEWPAESADEGITLGVVD